MEAFEDLDAADTLELLDKAPEPASAAKLTLNQIRAALKRARRRGDIDAKAARGWIHLILGVVLVGGAPFTGATWARIRAVIVLAVHRGKLPVDPVPPVVVVDRDRLATLGICGITSWNPARA